MRAPFCTILVIGVVRSTFGGPLDPPPGPVASSGRFGPRIEINQDNTPGDAFSTFVISQPGSYYLAGNVTGEANKRGISIDSSGVSIDFMGFELVGVANSGIGIRTDTNLANIVIMNGTVRDWGSAGINILSAANSVLSGLICVNNGGDGLTALNTVVSQCVARENGANGISVAFGAVDQCVAVGNGDVGLLIALGTLSNSMARDNDGSGIFADGATVIGCSSSSNGSDGISTGSSNVIVSNAVLANEEHGIDLSSYSCVIQNNCRGNGTGGVGAGIFVGVGEGNRLEANNVVDNPIGIDIDAQGNLVIKNSAHNNGTEYDIVAGNAVGTVIGGGNIISSNPWANIDY